MSADSPIPDQEPPAYSMFVVGECKFCHAKVWFGRKRVYNPGGVEFHIKSCDRRAAYFKARAAEAAETYRQRRMNHEAAEREARERMKRRLERLSRRNR